MSLRTCQRTVKRFIKGNFSAHDEIRSGRPSVDVKDKIKLALESDNHATSIALEIEEDKTTVWRNL